MERRLQWDDAAEWRSFPRLKIYAGRGVGGEVVRSILIAPSETGTKNVKHTEM